MNNLRPCDGDCFHCKYPDCVRTPCEILAMELGKSPMSRSHGWKKTRKKNTEWSPERIRQLRGDLSRKEFAEKVGCSATALCYWELGHQYPNNAFAERLRELEG